MSLKRHFDEVFKGGINLPDSVWGRIRSKGKNYLLRPGTRRRELILDMRARLKPVTHAAPAVAISEINPFYSDMSNPPLRREKVDLLIATHETSRTGAPLIIYHIAKRLVEDYGLSCVIIACRGGEMYDDFNALGSTFVESSYPWASSDDFVSSILRRYKFKGAIVNSLECHCFYSAIAAAGLKQITLVHEFTHPYNNDPFIAQRMKIVHKGPVIFPARIIKKSFEDSTRLNYENSFVWPQGIFNPAFPEGDKDAARKKIRAGLGLADDAFVALGCGYVDLRKGCDFFIDVAAELAGQGRNIHFVWVGDCSRVPHESGQIMNKIKDFGLENIHFPGAFKDVTPWFLAADCFLMCSRNDPFPSVVLEAMAAGLPVICFDRFTGSADVVEEDAGYVVPYFNIEAVTEKLVEFYDNPEKRRAMGAAGRRKIERNHDYDEYVRRIHGLLELEAPPLPPAGKKTIYCICYSWGISGANMLVEKYGLKLREMGWDFRLLFTRYESIVFYHRADNDNRPKVPYEFLPVNSFPSLFSFWAGLADFLNRRSPCIAMMMFDHSANAILPALDDTVAAVAWNHADDLDYYEQIQRLGRYFNASVSVSSLISHNVKQICPSLDDTHIPNTTISRDQLAKSSLAGPDKLGLVYNGRLEQYQKRARDLAQVVRGLNEQKVDYRLTIVGDGSERAWLENEMKAELEDGRVVITGRVPFDRVLEILRRNHIFLLMSDFEGMPLSLLEAMSQGCVSLVSDIKSGVPEIIEDGVNGFILKHRDYATWAAQAVEIFRDREKFAQRSRRAIETVRKGYLLEDIVARYDKVLQGVLEQAASGAYTRPEVLKWRSAFGDVIPPYNILWPRQLVD